MIPFSEWHWYKQKVPVKCRICTSRKQKHGKIVDCVSSKPNDIRNFLKQHCRGFYHKKAFAKTESYKIGTELGRQQDPDVFGLCQGICFGDPSLGPLTDFEHHFKLWFSWKSENVDLQRHNYKYDDETKSWEIKHADCLGKSKVKPGARTVCQHCMKLTHKDSLRRVLVTCALKQFGAELLHAKLFRTETEIKELEDKMKQDIIYHRHSTQVDKILAYKDCELQQWVRFSFCSVTVRSRSPAFTSFLETRVLPAISVNVVSTKKRKPELLEAQLTFERFLKDPRHSDAEKIDIAVAQAGLQGRLRGDPLMLGMVLSCLKVVDRKEAGKKTHGPNSKESGLGSELAVELAAEAGTVLAASVGNSHFLSRFGFSKKHLQMDDFGERLRRAGLPVPFLALSHEETIRNNMLQIDQSFSAFTNTCGRDFVALGHRRVEYRLTWLGDVGLFILFG